MDKKLPETLKALFSNSATKAVIVADKRENNGANPHFDEFVAIHNKKHAKLGKIQVVDMQIDTGDYNIFLNLNGHIKLCMCVERKTWKDLASSKRDGRKYSQVKKMGDLRDLSGCYNLFIIEGPLGYVKTRGFGNRKSKNNITFGALHTSIRRSLLKGIPFVQAKDARKTADILVDFARDLMELFRDGDISFPACDAAERSDAEEYLKQLDELNKKFANIPIVDTVKETVKTYIIEHPIAVEKIDNIVDTVAASGGSDDLPMEAVVNAGLVMPDTNIIEQLTKRKIKSDSDILINMWKSLPGISDKTAPVLMTKYSFNEFMCSDPAQTHGEIALLTYPSGTKIGTKRADKITEILYNGSDVIKSNNVRTLSARILAQVPMVTVATAKIVLDKFSLRDICSGKVDSAMIAETKRSNGRAIGKKISGRIISILQGEESPSKPPL